MDNLITQFQAIVGNNNFITNHDKMESYVSSFRGTKDKAWATALPSTLVELWQTAKLAVENDLIIICQAANTSLTGGSTPDGEYERPVIIISTIRLKNIQLINENTQAVCFAGSRLYELEALLEPLNREPHSVLGSSCVGASIVGGICNNSGGALIRRGPAFTQYSIYAQIINGKLELINDIGINLGTSPEEILSNLQIGNYKPEDVTFDPNKKASSTDYINQVTQIDEPSAARYNNDPKRLYKSAGSAGKLVVFAVRTDTFEVDPNKKTFYIATKNPDVLMEIRRDILGAGYVPDQGEYMDASSYDQAYKYGRDMHLIISKLGAKYIPGLFKSRTDIQRKLSNISSLFKKYPPVDYALELLNKLTPSRLSKRICEMRPNNDHFLFICTSRETTDYVTEYLANYFKDRSDAQYIECTEQESKDIQLHRFVIGSAEGRYRLLNRNKMGETINLDLALPRNATKFVEDDLPQEITSKLYAHHSFGHFFCLVFHNYYSALPGVDTKELKKLILKYLDSRDAQCPAEHNVGHLYHAKPELANFYKEMNPNNRMNPGIGLTSRVKDWK